MIPPAPRPMSRLPHYKRLNVVAPQDGRSPTSHARYQSKQEITKIVKNTIVWMYASRKITKTKVFETPIKTSDIELRMQD